MSRAIILGPSTTTPRRTTTTVLPGPDQRRTVHGARSARARATDMRPLPGIDHSGWLDPSPSNVAG